MLWDLFSRKPLYNKPLYKNESVKINWYDIVENAPIITG